MSKKFYTADTHFFHKNILVYCQRNFSSIEEHDATLIENWNKKVGKNDTIYILGDFSISTNNEVITNYAKQLNGHKILIRGNHDKNHMPEGLFDEITWYKEVHDFNYKVILFHWAIAHWQGSMGKDLRDGTNTKKPSIHLHGHSHSLSTIVPNRYDVGVDVQGFQPVTLMEILNRERDDLIGH